MNTYLTIMVTVMVLTQVIRITQNTIMLRRQNKAILKDVAWIKDNNITQRDFEVQRDCYYLLRLWLEDKMKKDYGEDGEET